MSYPTQTPGWSPQRRALTSMSALDYVALACLGASLIFWTVVYWLVLDPPPLPQVGVASLIAVVMALMSAIIPPLLWSMLVPTTPAGQLLQKTQWYTVGFVAIVAAAIFMTFYGWQLLTAFWSANDKVVGSGQVGYLTIFCLIGFVLIPALAWTVVTPERWLIQIYQDREVRKINRMRQLEDLSYKAMIARVRAVLNAELNGDASRLPELTGLLLASQKLTNQAISSVAAGYEQMYDVELRLGLEQDPDLETRYRSAVNHLLTAENAMPAIALPEARLTSSRAPDRGAAQQHAEYAAVVRAPDARVADAAGRTEAQSAPPQGRGADDAHLDALVRQSYVAARAALDGAWLRADLDAALSCSKESSLRLIRKWRAAGLVVDVSDPADRYRFVEVA